MSDPTAPVEGAPSSTPEAPAQTGPDISPVLDRMSELAANIDTKFGELEQRFPQPQQPPEPDPWASLFPEQPQGQPEFDPFAQPAQQPQFDPNALRSAYQADLSAATAPLQAQLAEMQLQQATARLYEQIPQLADKPENAEVRAATAQRVQEALARYSPQDQQKFGNDPGFIALVFKAAEAEKLAQGQAPAGGQPPSLEAAGGALPGGNGEPTNPVHQAYGNQPTGLAKGFN